MTSTEGLMNIAGGEIFVRQTGSGRPLLLLNGIGSHTAMWRALESVWPGRRLISFDAPGVGRSARRFPPLRIGALARQAEQLLDELGLEQVDVLGYSLGGTVAQTLARQAPHRVRRLVLVSTGPGWGGVPGPWRSMFHLFNPVRFVDRGYHERSVASMAGGQAKDPEFRARHAADRLVSRPDLVGFYGQVSAACSWSSLTWLPEIATETLVVTGGDDPMMPPANSMILARRIPHGRLRLYPADGHLLLFDDRSPALPDIAAFLDAEVLDDAAVWREAAVVGDAEEHDAIRSAGAGLFPFDRLHKAYRTYAGSRR